MTNQHLASHFGAGSEPVIIIIDDDDAMREALVCLVESVGLNAVDFARADDFLASSLRPCVGVIITDMRIPGTSGLGLLEKLRASGQHLPVIVISAFANLRDGVRAMSLGAVDVLEKPFDEQSLLDKLQDLIGQTRDRAGQCCLTAQAKMKMKMDRLTNREREVMGYLAQGLQNKNIANALGLSVKTVEIHRHNVLNKLEVHTLVDVYQLAQSADRATGTGRCCGVEAVG
ncbi:response regulator [Pseudovibrio sp. Tun.PSC04-5.I4]|uniref:response regulator transcription factor n=1 Tax=Pseudovibrio sp. Tun.PSC04-5.I4 TaxID=1798213 RepID=UPI0008839C9E|nr:response regulator [Pseudovibrio sp. Tun.PSC04-5.I4]SDR06401.1 Two-component response regulator, FixJ family, consists of REC and HTH domains [Pseudovibrio sp. Tun.PSC04-5.I4]